VSAKTIFTRHLKLLRVLKAIVTRIEGIPEEIVTQEDDKIFAACTYERVTPYE